MEKEIKNAIIESTSLSMADHVQYGLKVTDGVSVMVGTALVTDTLVQMSSRQKMVMGLKQ